MNVRPSRWKIRLPLALFGMSLLCLTGVWLVVRQSGGPMNLLLNEEFKAAATLFITATFCAWTGFGLGIGLVYGSKEKAKPIRWALYLNGLLALLISVFLLVGLRSIP